MRNRQTFCAKEPPYSKIRTKGPVVKKIHHRLQVFGSQTERTSITSATLHSGGVLNAFPTCESDL